MKRRNVAIGLRGTVIDTGKGPGRWEKWRPSVALCQHEDLLIHRFELLYQAKSRELAQVVLEDVRSVSPETEAVGVEIGFDDPWDFEAVYAALHDYARARRFQPEKEALLVHITTGSHVAQICLFLLAESHHLPGKLIQTSPPPRRQGEDPGGFAIIDLDLSKYDRLASRFREEVREGVSFLKSGIATRNQAFNGLMEMIERVAI